MALSAIAWLVIMVVVILSLTFAPNWSLVILIVVGKIAQLVKRKRQKTAAPSSRAPPDSATDAGDDPSSPPGRPGPCPRYGPDSDFNFHQSIAITTPSGPDEENQNGPPDPPPWTSQTLDPAPDASATAVDATAGDTPVDAPSPAWAVDPAGKTRRKLESSSSSSGIEYDLYLSFIDKDAEEFVSDLCIKLNEPEIKAFIHSEHLRIKEAIKQSRICIPILSRNFPQSKFCLDELVQMWECRESTGQTIFPIFYGVSPSDVELQDGDFGTSFSLHEKGGDDSKFIETWREILRKIGRIKGLVVKDLNRNRDELVAEVVRAVQVLKNDEQVLPKKLVGIDDDVLESMEKLCVTCIEGQATELSEDVRVIAIRGMEGIGKTTLAKVIFNKTREQFDACCFIEDIHPSEASQERLIGKLLKLRVPLELVDEEKKKFHNKKVLIVLDNVPREDQIMAFTKDLTWLGPGSRIIVTTRAINFMIPIHGGLYRGRPVDHHVQPLSFDNALQLFRVHAFGENAPEDYSEYASLCEEIVKATEGLPSALENIGSTLYGEKRKDIWKATLASLQEKTEKWGLAAFRVSHARGSDIRNFY